MKQIGGWCRDIGFASLRNVESETELGKRSIPKRDNRPGFWRLLGRPSHTCEEAIGKTLLQSNRSTINGILLIRLIPANEFPLLTARLYDRV